MIKIEKNVPMANVRHKYPFAHMTAGDSFFVAGSTPRRMGGAIFQRKKASPGEEYVTRTVEGGVRVWRVA